MPPPVEEILQSFVAEPPLERTDATGTANLAPLISPQSDDRSRSYYAPFGRIIPMNANWDVFRGGICGQNPRRTKSPLGVDQPFEELRARPDPLAGRSERIGAERRPQKALDK